MPTTKMPVWIRSEYVTIGQPPFPWIRGQKLPPVGGQPPTVYGSAMLILSYAPLSVNSRRLSGRLLFYSLLSCLPTWLMPVAARPLTMPTATAVM